MVRRQAGPVRLAAIAGALAIAALAPDARAVTIRQLVEVADIGGLSISPDGRSVAFRTERASLERNTYDTVWYVQPVDGSASARRLGEAGAPLRDAAAASLVEPAVWSADGAWIYYRAVLDGRIDVWRAAVDGSRTERVTRDAANVRRFALDAAGVLAYSVGATREEVVEAERDEYDRGVRIDRTVPLGDSLFESGYHQGRLAAHRLVHNELERFPMLSQAPDRWKAVDPATGTTRPLALERVPPGPVDFERLPQELGEVIAAAEDARGRIAFLARGEARDGMPERSRLAVLRGRDAREWTLCSEAPCLDSRITAITWRTGSDDVVFTVTDEASGHSLFRWNVASGAVRPVAATRGHLGDGGRWDTGPCAAAAEALVCVAADADRPPRVERVELESGGRTVLFDPNAALAHDMAANVVVRPIEWKDADGRRYTGLFYPAETADGTPPPLFVMYYRCSGFVRGSVGDEWPFAVLAREGIAVLCLNAPPLHEDAVARYDQGRVAIESAVERLASQGEADPARVGLGGLSFGGEVAMWAAMHSSMPRAASISTPVISPQIRLLFSPWEEVYFSRLRRYWQLGDPDETPDRWRLMSPAFDVERVRIPILMQMSEQEYRGSLDYAIPLVRMGRADVYVYPHEVHQKFQPRHKLAVYTRNLDWFGFWLADREDADPAKAEQYVHWREMRRRAAQ